MRYLVGFVFVLSLVALPQSVSAQDEETQTDKVGATSEPSSSKPAPEEPALQLQLDSAGVDVATGKYSYTYTDYTEQERRVKRARAVLISMAFVTSLGVALGGAGVAVYRRASGDEIWKSAGLVVAGGVIGGLGLLGMIGSGVRLRRNKTTLREMEEAGSLRWKSQVSLPARHPIHRPRL